MPSGKTESVRELNALKNLTGVPVKAVFGDNLGGTIYPDSTYVGDESIYPVRLLDGLNSNGVAVPGSSVPMQGDIGLINEFGMDLLVVRQPNGVFRFERLDNTGLAARAKNPAQFTMPHEQPSRAFRRNIMSGKILPDRASEAYTQLIRRYDYSYLCYSGTVRDWILGAATALDISGDFPSIGKERYILTYHDTTNGTNSYVTTATQTTTNDFPHEYAAIRSTLVGLLPHQLVQQGEIFRLDGTKAIIDQTDWRDDLRDLWTAPQPTSFPMTLTRNWLVPSNYQQLVDTSQNGITLSDGMGLLLGAGAALVSSVNSSNAGGVAAQASGGKPALKQALATKTGAYTLTDNDGTILVDASGGAVTITLLSAATVDAGRMYHIKAIDVTGGNVTIDTTSSQTIDDQLTRTITGQYTSVSVVSDGANWWVV